MEREEYGGGGRIFKKSVCVKKGEINTHTTPTLIWIGAIPPHLHGKGVASPINIHLKLRRLLIVWKPATIYGTEGK